MTDEDDICEVCDDSGEVECEECEGSGVDQDGDMCMNCSGSGSVECPECG